MTKWVKVILIMCFLGVFCTNTFAADIRFDRNDGSVEITGKAEIEENISVIVLKPGITVEQVKNTEKLNDAVQYFYEFITDAQGEFSEKIHIGDASNIYEAIIGGEQIKEEVSFETFSKEEINTYIEKLKNASINGMDAVAGALSEDRMRTVLGLNDFYLNDSTKSDLIESLSKKTDYESYADVESVLDAVLNRYTCLEKINSSINKAQIKDLLAEAYALLDRNDDVFERYEKMNNTDAVDTIMFNAKPYSSLTTFVEKLPGAIEEATRYGTQNGNSHGGPNSSGGRGDVGVSTGIVAAGNNLSTADTRKEFTDVPAEHWAYQSISFLFDNGVVSGRTENTFCPDERIRREEFVKMVVCAMNLSVTDKTDSFTDTNKNAWYSKYLNVAFENGIIAGRTDGSFGIGEYLTRQDMAVMILRSLNVKEISFDIGEKINFNDEADISNYAKESVSVLASAGIIHGMGNGIFSPTSATTRAEAAQIIYQIMKLEGAK